MNDTQPIIERRYSLREIDTLREIVKECDQLEHFIKNSWVSQGGSEWNERIEMRLRTLLMAGVSVEDAKARSKELGQECLKLRQTFPCAPEQPT